MGIRSKISSSDFSAASQTGYSKGGFGIKAARQPERTILTPEQFSNQRQIADFIKKMFPLAYKFGRNCGCDSCELSQYKLRRDRCHCRWCKQTTLATRWGLVIVQYFSLGQTDIAIELEHNWKPGTVGSIVQKIRRVIAGQRQDGLPRTGKPRGRPKKIGVSKLEISDNQKIPTPAVDKIESTVFANSC
jgi:hypothetical protein